MDKLRDGALRLAGVLGRYAEDRRTVEQIARLVNYLPDQLQEDMKTLLEYVEKLGNSAEGP